MLHSRLLAASIWLGACSSADVTAPQDAAADRTAPETSTESGSPADAAGDAHTLPPPTCQTGDRTEWTGTIPNTAIAVAVCSTCGESYVVAANGSASDAEVTVDNGSTTLTTTISANAAATSATLADDPSSGTVTVCGTSGTHGCLASATGNEQYCNPYRSVTSLSPERIDQGVDFGGAGAIYAIGPGTIDQYNNRDDSGWPGGTFVSYKLTAGPASGNVVYLAENIDLNPALHAGSYVFSGTVLGTLVNAAPDSESGWGVLGAGYTAEYSCYTEGCSTALGVNFNQLLVCLKAPSGLMGTSGCCTSSVGYPTDWCPLLSSWQ
jgi:hypothetical protein